MTSICFCYVKYFEDSPDLNATLSFTTALSFITPIFDALNKESFSRIRCINIGRHNVVFR